MKKVYYKNREYNSISELAKFYNISIKTLYSRLKRNYSIEDAITLTKEQTKKKSLQNFEIKHKTLSENEVRERMSKFGYTIINYNYKNNLTRMLCYDKNGYKVYMSLSGAEKKRKSSKIFYYS